LAALAGGAIEAGSDLPRGESETLLTVDAA
jgi:hypothetical protein